jgi:NAD(P)-dependent dehydrogenase (short-subunit alcohol dehydrogenase family)
MNVALEQELTGTTALVTGSTSGIGRATALRLAELGAQVIVTGRDKARAGQILAEISEAGGTARFIAADLSKPGDIQRLAAEAGPVDILVNNAGFPGSGRPRSSMSRRSTGSSRPTSGRRTC